jgi:hypothetical protein
MAVCVAGTIAAAFAVATLSRIAPDLAARALGGEAILLLGIANLGWLLLHSMGSYLRAWREEPLMEVALAGSVFAVIGTAVAASWLSTVATVAAHSILVSCGVLPIAWWRLRRQRRQFLR